MFQGILYTEQGGWAQGELQVSGLQEEGEECQVQEGGRKVGGRWEEGSDCSAGVDKTNKAVNYSWCVGEVEWER